MPWARRGRVDTAVVVEPSGDLVGVEADEVTPLYEGDAPFVDEAANVTNVHAEGIRYLGDGEELR